MKAKFYPVESEVIDLLKFAKVYFLKTEDDIKDDEYHQWIQSLQQVLGDYQKDIQSYYLKDEYATLEFNQLLLSAFPILGHNKITYFDSLLKTDRQMLKTKLFEAMVKSQQESIDEVNNPISFIQRLEIDLAYKWQLLVMIEDPKPFLEGFIVFINSIEPLFSKVYETVKSDVFEVGYKLEKHLRKDGIQAIESLSQGRIKSSVVDHEQLNLFVSGIFKYMVTINPKPNELNLIWGLNMEKAFLTLKEQAENLLTDRVQVFKNLGDKTRYEVVKLISKGITSIKEIATQVGVSSATISYHLNELLNSGIVTLENQNKKFSYVIDYPYLEKMIQSLKDDLDFPKPKL